MPNGKNTALNMFLRSRSCLSLKTSSPPRRVIEDIFCQPFKVYSGKSPSTPVTQLTVLFTTYRALSLEPKGIDAVLQKRIVFFSHLT